MRRNTWESLIKYALILGIVIGFCGGMFNSAFAESYFGYDEWGGTWHDANKKIYWIDDDDMCWAAVASNVLFWGGWAPYYDSAQEVFEGFVHLWSRGTGNSLNGWSWWLNGVLILNQASQPNEPGNFWSISGYDIVDYFYENSETQGNEEHLLDSIATYLHNGYGVRLSITEGGDVGHAITVWGYEYAENGDYTGIWITDSDDSIIAGGLHGREKKPKLLPVQLIGNYWYLGGDYDGWYIEIVQALDRISGDPISDTFRFETDPEELYAPTAPTFYPKGDFSDNTTYTWTFNDGENVTVIEGKTPTFQILHPGEYHVEMTANDPILGNVPILSDIAKTIRVEKPRIQVSTPEGRYSLKRIFSHPTTLLCITQYIWDFGDGTFASGNSTKEHIYASRGKYTVTLTLNLTDGSILTNQKTVTVGPETQYIQTGIIQAGGYEVWDGVVVVQGDVTVAEGATLSIEPGTIVKFEDNTSLLINGRLIVEGTPDKNIVLTSYYDDEHDGDTNGDGDATQPGGSHSWDGIELSSTSTNSTITHAIVRYGWLVKSYSAMTIHENTFDDTGISVQDAPSIVTGNHVNGRNIIAGAGTSQIIDNTITGGYIYVGSSSGNASPIVTGNTVIGSDTPGSYGIYISLSTPGRPQISGNTISHFDYPVYFNVLNGVSGLGENTTSDNSYDAIYLRGGGSWLEMDGKLNKLKLPYIIGVYGVHVMEGYTLTIDPGTTVKFEDDGGIHVDGTLLARGTAQSKIIFTSLYDDEYGGDTNADGSATRPGEEQSHYWNSISFSEESSPNSVIEHVVIKYAGHVYPGGPEGAISSIAPDLTILNNEIQESNGHGINIGYGYGNDTATAAITGNTITGGHHANSHGVHVASSSPLIRNNTIRAYDHGIYCTGWDSEPQIHNNVITNNLSYGVANIDASNCPTINAANNNWGDPSGPLDDSDDRATGGWYSPEGLGNRVSDDVDYFPYGRTVPLYTISGCIRIANTLGVQGVLLNGLPDNPVTDENGCYSSTVESNWSGTVTPQGNVDISFEPASITYTTVTEDQIEQNYTLKFPDTFTLSGYVRDPNSNGIAEVLLKGLPDNPRTDNHGFYIATVPLTWSGTVIPQKDGFTFAPVSQDYTNVTSDYIEQNYASSTIALSISGHVYDKDGIGIPNVIVDGLPGPPITDNTGFFSATVESGWSGTVVPERAGYLFTPENRVYTNITTDQADQNYTESSQHPLIVRQTGTGIGTVSSIPAGITCGSECTQSFREGSVVTLSATPDSSSTFAGWSGEGCSGTGDCVLTMDTARAVSAAFTRETYTISGTITDGDIFSPIPLEGVALNGFPGITLTNSSGNYSTTVPAGWSGMIVPQKTGYTFTDSQRAYTNIMAHQMAQDYTASPASCTQSQYKRVVTWGAIEHSADGQFEEPRGVTIDHAGNIYVIDSARHLLQKFDSTGTFLTKWGAWGYLNTGEFQAPYGLAFDSAGNIYVADTSNHRIQKFDNNGNVIDAWGTWGTGDGQFNEPYGIAIDSADIVFVADTHNNRIQKFDHTGTFLGTWGTTGTGNSQFNSPKGIAVDSSGNIYVADTGNDRIQKFDNSGTFLTEWGSYGFSDGQFDSPIGITVDTSSTIYVVDQGNNRVQKFDNTGTFLATWGIEGEGDGQFMFPHGIAADSADNIYIADTYNYRLQKFDSTGTFLSQVGNDVSADGYLLNPQAIAVDDNGTLYVADSGNHRIQRFGNHGGYMTQWGIEGSGNSQFQEASGVAIDSTGNIYVADTLNHRIQKFDTYGMYASQWGSYGTGNNQFISPTGIAIDNTDNVYVVDQENDRIQKFTSDGTYLAQWGAEGSGNSQFQTPVDVAVDSMNNVYVTDKENHRVQKFDSNGSYLTQWGSQGAGNAQFELPGGVSIDVDDNVYVADSGNARIQKFDGNGEYLTEWQGTCTGLTVDGGGNVYVVDGANNSVTKFAHASPLISGRINASDGEGLGGVVLTGLPNDPETNSDGYYAVYVDSCWNGTVTPQKAGYTFTPAAWTYASISADHTDHNYTGTLTTYEISGHIQDTSGTAVAGVLLHGLPGNPITDETGYYHAVVNIGWSGTVSPQKSEYSFAPGDRVYNDINTDQIDQYYTASEKTYSISGYVRTSENVGIQNVTMDGLPGSPLTDTNGYYETTVSYDWSGTVTPQKASLEFIPGSRRYDKVMSDLVSQDYTQTPETVTISGYIFDETGTVGIEGVVLQGFPGNPVSDATGHYSVTVAYDWSGNVALQKMGFAFTPPGRTYTGITRNLINHNYTGTFVLDCANAIPLTAGISYNGDTTTGSSHVSSYNCSGWNESGPEVVHTITTTVQGDIIAFLENKTASLNVFILDTCNPNRCVACDWDTATYADAPPGTYYIVVDGYNGSSGSYTLTVIDPSSLSYTISGYVRDTEGTAIPGTNLNGLPGNPSTDSNGSYSAVVYEGWSGTATPGYWGANNYLFDPVNRTYNAVTADYTTQNYTGTLLPDDAYEENDWYMTAWDPGYKWENTWLSSINGIAYQSDYDYYKIDVEPGSEMVRIQCLFSHAAGNINLGLYNASGYWVTSTYSTTDNESLEFAVPGSGTYYIGVFGDNVGNTYDLWWDDTATPEIHLKQGTMPVTKGSTYDFETIDVGTSTTVTFTVENLGVEDLLLTGNPIIQLLGTHVPDFSVTSPTISTLLPGTLTTFNVTFTPTAPGIRTAIISIANNDSDENPYTFTVTGTGQAQASNSYILWTK